MSLEFLLFLLFFLLTVFCAIMVVNLTNSVIAVFFLILTFFNIALLLILLGSEFFSFLLLIVYVGAIAVLFLFVIMMLNIKTFNYLSINYFLIPILLFLLFSFFDQLSSIINFFDSLQFEHSFIFWYSWFSEYHYISNIQVIGNYLYTHYCFLFITSSIILLIAMIGVIVLTLQQKLNIKKQFIEIQLTRQSKNSLKFLRFRYK